MIPTDKHDIWKALAAPLDPSAVQWRQNGKPKPQGSGYAAPFVAYIEANTVRERLDAVVPGEWDLTLDLMPPLLSVGGDGDANDTPVAYKARLQVLGVIREDVGAGKDYKQASTDAFKRVAVRFGIGHELYSDYEITWVKVESDSKYAKALEDPAAVYARKQGQSGRDATEKGLDMAPVTTTRTQEALAQVPKPAPKTEAPEELPVCPKCSGPLWDNRVGKRNPRAPDWKCRDKACDGVIWPPKGEKAASGAKPGRESADGPYHADESEIPF